MNNKRIQTSVECDCKTCGGGGGDYVCTCFCHVHSLRSRKTSAFFNLMGGMCSEMGKAEKLTDEELATAFAENIGTEERVDSFKCSLIGEMLHRFKKYSEAEKAP